MGWLTSERAYLRSDKERREYGYFVGAFSLRWIVGQEAHRQPRGSTTLLVSCDAAPAGTVAVCLAW